MTKPANKKTATQTEFAEWNGVTRRTVHEWIKEGMPAAVSGKKGSSAEIETAIATQWLIDRALQKKLPTSGEKSDQETARARLYKVQAERHEMELMKAKGQLVDLDEVDEALTEFLTIITAELEGIAGRCASQVAGMSNAAAIRKLIQGEIRRAREHAASRIESLGVDTSPTPVVEASEKEGSGRMGKRQPRSSSGKRRTRRVSK